MAIRPWVNTVRVKAVWLVGLFLILYGVLREHLDESGSVLHFRHKLWEPLRRAREQERG